MLKIWGFFDTIGYLELLIIENEIKKAGTMKAAAENAKINRTTFMEKRKRLKRKFDAIPN